MKCRKIILSFSLFLSLAVISCSSTKTEMKADAEKNEQNSEINQNSQNEKNKNKSNKNKENKKNKKKTADLELKGDYGIVHLKANKRLGTYTINVSNNKNRQVSVLSDINEYTTNAFYLNIDGKIYKLCSNGQVKTEVVETDTGLKFTYHIKDTAEINVIMDCLTSVAGKESDMVKVTAKVINLNAKTRSFSLKTVMDTVLGENGARHFYNGEDLPVKVETIYRTMKNDRWFVSKNEKAAMQILVDGGDTTAADAVILANYSTLTSSDWVPDVNGNKTFDTLLSYNNSAVGIIWPEVKLEQYDDAKYVFYLAFATDEHKPTGDKFIYGGRSEEPVEVKVPVAIPQEKQVVPVLGDYESKTFNSAKFDPNTLSKQQLTPEYVQALVDRIEALESSGEAMNRDEILQLNEELDAILEVLRQ